MLSYVGGTVAGNDRPAALRDSVFGIGWTGLAILFQHGKHPQIKSVPGMAGIGSFRVRDRPGAAGNYSLYTGETQSTPAGVRGLAWAVA